MFKLTHMIRASFIMMSELHLIKTKSKYVLGYFLLVCLGLSVLYNLRCSFTDEFFIHI